MQLKGRIQIDKERCKGCCLCVAVCPKECIHLSEGLNLKGYFVATFVADDTCTGCGNCAVMCPDVAITVSIADAAAGRRSAATVAADAPEIAAAVTADSHQATAAVAAKVTCP